MNCRTLLPLAMAALLMLSRRAGCDEPPRGEPGATTTKSIELHLAPAAEPRPALQYRLLPGPSERKPGNAAPFYYRAMLLQKNLSKEYWQQHGEKQEAWLHAARENFPKAEVTEWLQQQRNVLLQVKEATYREYCDWDLRPQSLQGLDTVAFLLPELQEARTIARTLQLQARLETMDGRPEEALETLRMGHQLARDAAITPFLISGLVGIAIANVMNEELRHLIEHSDANYYWAIASLPQPLVDLRPAIQFEMTLPQQVFPLLKEPATTERSTDEWRRLIVECVRGLHLLHSNDRPGIRWEAELEATAMMTRLYPLAKQQLIAAGMDRERVEAMPVGQVVAIQTARATDIASHEIFKTATLPYTEAMRRLPELTKKLEKDHAGLGSALADAAGLPLASLLLPSLQNVLQAEARTARDLAALQTIEALRMHAAANGNKLPQTLAEVSMVPVPSNPATGEPFPYSYDAAAGTATLEIPAVRQPSDGQRYVVRLR